jgi:hypothetical protein
MLPRVLRTVLIASVALALWTLVRPARAAMPAGLCDDRGATAIAPAPTFDALDEAVRRARASASCPDHDLPLCATVVPAHRGGAPASADAQYALAIDCTQWPAPEATPVALAAHPERPLRGERSRIERPPRD